MRRMTCLPADPTPLFRHGGLTGPDGKRLVDFSASINPLGPPLSVLRVLRRELAAVARYPDPYCTEITDHLAAFHAVPPDQMVVGNGSNELIHLLTRALQPRRVAIVEPTYTEYLRAALLAGVETTHWLPEAPQGAPRPFDPGDADLLWLCNPNNPTGRLWSRRELLDWVDTHPETVFAVDEAFLPFVEEGETASLVAAVAETANLVVLRSMTKFYALPGLRLGYAVASRDLADRIRAQRLAWSVNSLAQAAGVAALADQAFLEDTRAWLGGALPELVAALGSLSEHLDVFPTHANFVLLRLKTMTAAVLADALQEHGFAVRVAANFIGLGEQHLRVAVRLPASNRRLVDAMRSVFERAR